MTPTEKPCNIPGVTRLLETRQKRSGLVLVQRLYQCENGWSLAAKQGGPLDLADGNDSWEVVVLDDRNIVEGQSAGFASDETLATAVARLAAWDFEAAA